MASSKKLTGIFKSKLSIKLKPSWMGRGGFLLRRTENLCLMKAHQGEQKRWGMVPHPQHSVAHIVIHRVAHVEPAVSQLESRQKQVY